MPTTTEYQVTVKGKGFTADFFATRTDVNTWSFAFKGAKAAEKWLAYETVQAEKHEYPNRPFIEQHLALISQGGTDKAAPVWVGGWLLPETPKGA